MKWFSYLWALFLGVVSCHHAAYAHFDTPLQLSTPQTSLTQHDKKLFNQAQTIYHILIKKQYDKLTPYIHPIKGVRFAMYANTTVNWQGQSHPDTNKVFSQKDFCTYLQKSKIRFTWGQKDGSGDDLVISLPNYLDTWVRADKLRNPVISIKHAQELTHYQGGIVTQAYLGESVDFLDKGLQKWDYMDWRLLRLVFEDYQGQFYLIAIINDEWTV